MSTEVGEIEGATPQGWNKKVPQAGGADLAQATRGKQALHWALSTRPLSATAGAPFPESALSLCLALTHER